MVANHYRWDFIGLSSQTKPTPANSEKVVDGSTFYECDTSKLYVFCKTNWYEKTVSGGGGGTSDFEQLTNRPKYNGTAMTGETNIPLAPTVVQTTGTSQSDVMSQDATSGMIFNDPATKKQIKIGASSQSNATDTVAIGYQAHATGNGNVAIGENSTAEGTNATAIGTSSNATGKYGVAIGGSSEADQMASTAIGISAKASYKSSVVFAGGIDSANGQFNVGMNRTGWTGIGYNNSDYRLITGIYDGQGAHDAVSVGQINDLIDAINTAGSFNISHIGA